MECSWKTVLLLVCASFGVQYTAIRSLRDSFTQPCHSADRCRCCLLKGTNPDTADAACSKFPSSIYSPEHRWRSMCDDVSSPVGVLPLPSRRHILLFATTRSGSSFTGQLFNQHPGIFYVFEPLYHVQQALTNSTSRSPSHRTPDRRVLLGAYRDLLHNLYTCDLHFLESYIRPEPRDHLTASFFRRGSSRALCSPPVCPESSGVMGQPEEVWCPRRCQALNLTLASQACMAQGHVAIKTVRFPEVDDLRPLSQDPRMDLRIIHLVRDPRGILASRMAAFTDQFRAWKVWNATGRQPRYVDLAQITRTCRDLASSAAVGLHRRPAWLRGRYLLVRYEDLARHPEGKAKEIYRFVGLEMDERVRVWISRNTNHSAPSATEGDYRYSTTRDSRATAESWRLHLAYDIVRAVQALCNDTLSLLGYRLVHSAADLKNMSHSVVFAVSSLLCPDPSLVDLNQPAGRNYRTSQYPGAGNEPFPSRRNSPIRFAHGEASCARKKGVVIIVPFLFSPRLRGTCPELTCPRVNPPPLPCVSRMLLAQTLAAGSIPCPALVSGGMRDDASENYATEHSQSPLKPENIEWAWDANQLWTEANRDILERRSHGHS
ncbi:hypothetical protein AAFF_G00083020 [Aldrovandia affinis]|uniref:Sulfotransferase domain-containing protein n=1 Tax=Aldrovandia affinis TaxID=143900 RepID=A0AAD7WCH2_9TELE|nr:hypothetical protein AAFF_G00083020 [Aldrovandia affinis]